MQNLLKSYGLKNKYYIIMLRIRIIVILSISVILSGSINLIAQQVTQPLCSANQLSQPQEKRFNEIQPPELVMDILGIRPGLIIGEVAWFYCILDDINTFKGKPAEWRDTRWTGTVEKREGKWVIVQQHFSFASEK
jgi:hypothetical protein